MRFGKVIQLQEKTELFYFIHRVEFTQPRYYMRRTPRTSELIYVKFITHSQQLLCMILPAARTTLKLS